MTMKFNKLAVVVTAMMVLPSMAYGLNITVNDNMNNSGLNQITSNEGWNNLGLSAADLASAKRGIGIGVGAEDNEIEPSCITGQNWDLEAIVLSEGQKTITLLGGYNWFLGYQTFPHAATTAGDLFLGFDIPGAMGSSSNVIGGSNPVSPTVGPYRASQVIAKTFGYDYVFDVAWNAAVGQWNSDGTWSNKSSYSLLDLNAGSALTMTAALLGNQGSDPFSYVSGSTSVLSTGLVEMARYKDNELVSLYGGDVALTGASSDSNYWHYAVTFSLGSIWADLGKSASGLQTGDPVNLWAHITQSCGNDNLYAFTETTAGSDTPVIPVVPEPTSITLLLLGVIGTVARKRFVV